MKLKRDRYYRKLLLSLSGQTGAHLVSLASLSAALLAARHSTLLIVEMLASVVLIRVLYCMTRGPRPVLPGRFLRRELCRVAADETKVGVAMAAGCFVMQWPVSLSVMAAFFALNLIAQCLLSRTIIKRLARDRKASKCSESERQVLVVGTGRRGIERVASQSGLVIVEMADPGSARQYSLFHLVVPRMPTRLLRLCILAFDPYGFGAKLCDGGKKDDRP